MSGIDTLHLGDNLDRTATPVLHYLLTECEAAILDAASRVQYGELLDVEVASEERTLQRLLSPQQKAFIEALRREGLTFLQIVIVHNGCPSQVEVDGQYSDIRYRRKIRFN
jgi:hypothetical protein